MSLHYAWVGLIGGIGAVRRVDSPASPLGCRAVSWACHQPVPAAFALGFVLTLASTLVLLGMRADNRYGVGEFLGMFFRGNPFL